MTKNCELLPFRDYIGIRQWPVYVHWKYKLRLETMDYYIFDIFCGGEEKIHILIHMYEIRESMRRWCWWWWHGRRGRQQYSNTYCIAMVEGNEMRKSHINNLLYALVTLFGFAHQRITTAHVRCVLSAYVTVRMDLLLYVVR